MARTLEIHTVPEGVARRDLAGAVGVVIDVFRASTTIVHALAAGAKAVIPCPDVEVARARAAALSKGDALFGGERNGVQIDGFDLDNSPLKYTEQTVAGKTIVFTTTNGTRALEMCQTADRVLIAGFVNLAAVVRALAADNRHVHLVCAGTRGEISAEDVFCAAAIADELVKIDPRLALAGSDTMSAVETYRASAQHPQELYDAVRASPGARDLQSLGFEADIERSLQRDLFAIVPEYDRVAGVIKNK